MTIESAQRAALAPVGAAVRIGRDEAMSHRG